MGSCRTGSLEEKGGEELLRVLFWVVVSNIFYFQPYLGK